ncbi:uncharacterized protein B0T15DRAFT_138216 [Chaetomium strumarium]|uniref:Uncharacterized protein n=1 Tax=Chaetomium strumarium TaxID=1170767 RepID=A0AAJ0GUL1_9PEZI|nr:hypothetical protein B0T15DRAFT_138216 [Chaetomium strumarium]
MPAVIVGIVARRTIVRVVVAGAAVGRGGVAPRVVQRVLVAAVAADEAALADVAASVVVCVGYAHFCFAVLCLWYRLGFESGFSFFFGGGSSSRLLKSKS